MPTKTKLQLENENLELTTLNQALINKAAEDAKTMQRLLGDFTMLCDNLQKMRQDNAQKVKELSELQCANAQKIKELSELQCANAQKVKELSELQHASAQKDAELSELRQENARKDAEFVKLQQEALGYNKKITPLMNAFDIQNLALAAAYDSDPKIADKYPVLKTQILLSLEYSKKRAQDSVATKEPKEPKEQENQSRKRHRA
jgi:hypothetical protein